MNAVETFNLSKQYKEFFAVDDISIKIPMGVKCGFLGKNGAGKTTTIKMLTGLKRPTAGNFSIMGKSQAFGERNLAIGYLPDVPNFYTYMTAAEFLDLCGNLCGIEAKARKEKIKSLLKQVGLDNTKKRISTYSRGMKQRLGIAQSLISSPAVVFMDEPMSALDPMGRRDVLDIIYGLKDTTVVFSTHILADVEDTCDYIIIIEKGKILAQESLVSLKSKYAQNKAYITFYEENHSQKAKSAIKQSENLQIDYESKLELSISSKSLNAEQISQKTSAILADLNLPFKSFLTDAPNLEKIFHETIKGVSDNA